MKEIVLVVGASGFVGKVVCQDLLRRGYRVRAAARRSQDLPSGSEHVALPDLTAAETDWLPLVRDVQAVVYLAARVHVMNDTHPDPLAAYRAVNRDAPLALAQAAAQAGVSRFIYLSSIKVNGEATEIGQPFTEQNVPAPTDPYGISKFEAEQGLLELGQLSNLEVVVLRPPLVYGPGVKANFMALARLAGRGWPLPLGAVRNRRSLIYVENLADLVAVVLQHPSAPGQVFLASDAEDLSTADLTRQLAEAQGRRAWLVAVPTHWLWGLGKMVGRSNMLSRLLGSLEVDSSKAREQLDWVPPYPIWQALARTGRSLQQLETPQPFRLKSNQRFYLWLRTPLERLAALVLLMAIAPLLLVVTLLVHFDSPGPVLFRQQRAGRGHRPFTIYKFRTMRAGTPNLSTEDMVKSGMNSITPIGAILRRTSLDELPQLLNVVKGEMSLIGPRPALLTQTPVLHLRAASGVDRLRPGITGYAQVTGRDDLPDEEKVQRDTTYLQRLSFGMDLAVARLTIRSVLQGTGNK